MERAVISCKDYTIFRVGTERLHDVAKFVVTENYNHHSSVSIPGIIRHKVEEVYNEELVYSNNSFCYIVRDNNGKMIGSIRVFKWDKHTPIPMQKIFNISPLETVGNKRAASFWHIGRFAIHSSVSFSTIILFKQLMTLAVSPIIRDNDSYMIAETDVHLLKVMNALGMKTRKIGSPLVYLESETIPIYSSKNGLIDFYKRHYPLISLS